MLRRSSSASASRTACRPSWSSTPGQRCYLRSLYHRHVKRNGGYRSPTAKKKAVVVVAHAMIVIIRHVMVTGKPYHELGADYFASLQDPERETRRLIAKLQALRHTVTINPAA